MPSNNPKGTLQSAAGSPPEGGEDGDDCKAWRAATKKWCDETKAHKDAVKKWANAKPPKGPRPELPTRKFNDYFFNELNTINPSLVTNTLREVPLGVNLGGGVYQNMATFAGQNVGSPAGMAAGAIGSAWTFLTAGIATAGNAPGAWDAARYAMNCGSRDLFASGARPFYPDGMRGGTAVELKGPGDREGDGQFKKYADTAPDGKCVVIDPKSCDPNQTLTTPKGHCKAGA